MSLKLQYASDLHLEFPVNKEFLKQHPLQPVGNVLVLAGDIVPFALMDKHKDFFSYLSDHFETTYWLPGNHEYYYYDIARKSGSFKERIRSNVHLVNNLTVEVSNTRILFSTLWSNISTDKQWFIEKSVSDFQVIKYDKFRFSLDRFNEQHSNCLGFIASELKKNYEGKTMVITHHVPTLLNYPEQYKNSELNDVFAVELFSLISDTSPDYWIYGHHHSNTPDFTIGKTKLLTNQLGYVQQNEHQLFKSDKCIEL